MKLHPMRLHELDAKVLDYMLDRDGEIYDELRAQLTHIKTYFRYVDGAGFYSRYGVGDAKPAAGRPNVVIMDVDGRCPEVSSEVGFILYVRDGLIHVLEGHTYASEDWPKQETDVQLFSDFFTRRGQPA